MHRGTEEPGRLSSSIRCEATTGNDPLNFFSLLKHFKCSTVNKEPSVIYLPSIQYPDGFETGTYALLRDSLGREGERHD